MQVSHCGYTHCERTRRKQQQHQPTITNTNQQQQTPTNNNQHHTTNNTQPTTHNQQHTESFSRTPPSSCSDGEGHLCWLGHGDILVMDGQCQDEFRHCTDPGSEQERINITFRWVKQHVASCSFLRTGVTCCLPTCARGFSFSDTGIVGIGSFWAFWFLLGTLCILGGTSITSLPSCVYKVWVSKMCPLLDTP